MTISRVQLDTTNFATEAFSESDDPTNVDASMFGAIQINQFSSENFETHFIDLDLHHIRIPGGALPELGFTNPATGVSVLEGGARYESNPELYTEHYLDLRYDDLFHPRAIESGRSVGFSEILALAVETESSISVILPTMRYEEDPYSVRADVRHFLNSLFRDHKFSDNLPTEITFDIGNENYDPQAYATVAIEILKVIQNYRLEFPELDFKVALQAMPNNQATLEMLAEFSEHQDLLAEIDTVRIHYLDHSLDQVSNMEDASAQTASVRTMLEATANADPSRSIEDIDLYFSAWTALSGDIYEFKSDDNLFALSNANTMLSLFSAMIELGTDMSAVWGMGAFTNNPTALYAQGGYAPAAQVYRMMSESLINTSLIDSPGLDNGYTNGTADAPYNMYAYADEAKTVIFLAANDYDDDDGLTVEIDLTNFDGNIGYIWAETVNTDGDGSAVVTRSVIDASGTSVSYTFSQDYEVVRIIVAEDNPGEGYLHLWGSADSDVLTGGHSDDLLEGNAGNDTLIGRNGGDIINGGAGNDTLNGGLGDDTLTGGAGVDTFTFGLNSGHDIIVDFTKDDVLKIRSHVISGTDINNLPADIEVAVDGDNLVIYYSGGTITLENSTIEDVFGTMTVQSGPIVVGGIGNETQVSGTDQVNDIFEIHHSTGIKLVIRGFADNEDMIDISPLGVSSFDELRMFDKEGHIQVGANGQIIKIYGLDSISQLSEKDFYLGEANTAEIDANGFVCVMPLQPSYHDKTSNMDLNSDLVEVMFEELLLA